MKTLKNCCAILLAISLLIAFCACSSSELKKIEANWKISLPNDTQVINTVDNVGWFGDGVKFALVVFKENDINFIAEYFSKNDESLGANDEFKDKIDVILKQLDLPKEYIPEWTDEYYRKDSLGYQGLFMLYFPNSMKLFLFESKI